MIQRWIQLSLVLGWLCLASESWAHRPSDSYLHLETTPTGIQAQWDISLRDLDYALGLDQDGDRTLRWGELRTQFPVIAQYALARLEIAVAGKACPSHLLEPMVDRHGKTAYAVLRFQFRCPSHTQEISVQYNLFFDLDAQHRGLLRFTHQDQTLARVFSPKQTRLVLSLDHQPLWSTFVEYLREGIWHITIGFDHILFLFTLLLPAVLIAKNEKPSKIIIDVAQVITAFTLAHSFTLCLATLGGLSLPSQWVESAIAASVVLAALNNLFPFLGSRRWAIAFVFGLLHGFGFASVLLDLELPNSTLGLALFAFNLGVEVGQLGIVLVFLPWAIYARESWYYRKIVYTFGSFCIALIGFLWLLERSLGLAV